MRERFGRQHVYLEENDMITHDVADIGLKVLGGVFAIVGFFVGLSQYRKGQNWKKAEIILGLIDSFKGDAKIRATCLMLDWDARDIQIDGKAMIGFHNEMLISALRIVWMNPEKTIPLDAVNNVTDPKSPTDGDFNPEEALIRDCFDAFFDYFDKINAFRRSALVEWADLSYFSYWFDRVGNIGREKAKPEIQSTLEAYLKTYDFKGFMELSRNYQNRKRRPQTSTNSL